jgi:hypothetical protein
MDRASLLSMWNEAWETGLWAASWKGSIEGLTPAQAVWQPAPGRHSIWQTVLHMVFWRENELRRTASGVKPTADEIARLNFPAPEQVTQAAWDEARRRFADTQGRLAAVIADPATNIDRISYLLPHDAYHTGQINYLRAMQGLKPIE